MNLIKQYTNWLIRHPPQKTITRADVIIGRNEPCPCGSKIKYKHCCLLKQPKPFTELAKKEFEKERKYLLKSVGGK